MRWAYFGSHYIYLLHRFLVPYSTHDKLGLTAADTEHHIKLEQTGMISLFDLHPQDTRFWLDLCHVILCSSE
jgi:hypothetical protein